MNIIKTKERNEAMRLRNVLKYLREHRNDLVGKHKLAKKNKDKNEQARLLNEKHKVEADIADLMKRVADATKIADKVAMEMSILRTKMYVMSYCLQGAAFELRSYLDAHAAHDGGELEFIEQIKGCCDVLMKMPLEFGEYGGKDNESFNICEEIISQEVDRGVRAAFDAMLNQEIDDK